jgi:phage replication-related protein YjqB (UPF0714/DUF867 family)
VSLSAILGAVSTDAYRSFAELAAEQAERRDFRRVRVRAGNSSILIIAPHGGRIEVGTSQIARRTAGRNHSLYLFEGLKPSGQNQKLHITSHHFDDPLCLEMVQRAAIVVTVHGCRHPNAICLGGQDMALRKLLLIELKRAGLKVLQGGHRWRGASPKNICNRGKRGRGVQLEISLELRQKKHWDAIASAVRRAIKMHAARLRRSSKRH